MKIDRKRKPLSQITLDDQVVHQKRHKPNDTFPIEQRAGTVSKMVLKNFMCHSLLEVDFETNINFIIGRNGSGKSAILTALIVGFGAKASVTNRGNSIKGFIKAGKNTASIEITLNNTGPMAYRPATYGDKIIVQRNITSNGGSSYKIRASTGEVISTQNKEIQRITTNLNIQVDNPVCILNQDTSRNFLSTSNPKQRFTLFMRATRLENLADEYEKILTNKKDSFRLLREKGQVLKELEGEIKELKTKYENLKSILTLKDKLSQLQLELLWAKARDSEHEYNQKERNFQAINAKYLEMEDNIQNKTKKFEDINKKVCELQQQIIELRNESETQAQPQMELRNKISALRDIINEKRREKQMLMRTIEGKMKECNALEKEISNFTTNLSRIEQEKVQRLKDIVTMEEKIKSIECLLETTQNDQFQMRNSIKKKQEEESTLRKETIQVKSEYSQTHEHLRTLQSKSDNNLLLYGQDMPNIIKAISDNEERFNQMPRGPLGSYIKIKDKKWAVAVEGFLSSELLRSFVVDNKQDGALLLRIFEKYWTSGSKPTIITSKFFNRVHDISRNLVHAVDGCLSVWDALDITDPVVANCLIDQTGMEGVLLIPTGQKARELLSEASLVPRNCRQGITINGDKYYPDPNYKTYTSRYHQARYLQVNTSDLIVDLQNKLKHLTAKQESIQNQHKTIDREIQEQSGILSELTKKLDKLSRARIALRQKHDEMKSSTDPEVGNIQHLEAELSELKRTIDEQQAAINEIDDNMKQVREKISVDEENLEKLKNISKGFEERMIPLEVQIMELASKKKELSVNENFERRRQNELKKRLTEAENEMKQKQQIMENHIAQASSVGDRMEQIRIVQHIANEINTTQGLIRKVETNTEKPEEIAKKYQDKLEKHRHSSEIMKSLEEDAKELQLAAEKRNRHYKLTEDYFITYIQHSFTNILEFRQFRGNLDIDMDAKTLEMVVIPQQGSQGLTTTANLSGGERSFSTVAFLYSLWQCMEFPFYFLDEFDVYMDKVNRTKVMEILIHHAKSRPELQFVFLTPQDVSFIHDDAVAVHRLEDPRRTQGE